jgi:hypothetical protein
MIEQANKYDPAIYGQLRAELLQKIDEDNKYFNIPTVNDNEQQRQQLIKDIQEGRLAIVKP